jgi:hypothetical protein
MDMENHSPVSAFQLQVALAGTAGLSMRIRRVQVKSVAQSTLSSNAENDLSGRPSMRPGFGFA